MNHYLKNLLKSLIVLIVYYGVFLLLWILDVMEQTILSDLYILTILAFVPFFSVYSFKQIDKGAVFLLIINCLAMNAYLFVSPTEWSGLLLFFILIMNSFLQILSFGIYLFMLERYQQNPNGNKQTQKNLIEIDWEKEQLEEEEEENKEDECS